MDLVRVVSGQVKLIFFSLTERLFLSTKRDASSGFYVPRVHFDFLLEITSHHRCNFTVKFDTMKKWIFEPWSCFCVLKED